MKPDVLIVGMSIVAQKGTGMVAEIAARFPAARVLLVAGKEDEELALATLKAGAHGALLKPLRIEAVRQKVDTILGRPGGATLVKLGGLCGRRQAPSSRLPTRSS